MKIYKDLYERTKEKTLTDFGADYKKDPDDEYVYVYNEDIINSMLEELLMEIDRLEEEYEDYKENVSENYKQIPKSYYELYGVSEKDFC